MNPSIAFIQCVVTTLRWFKSEIPYKHLTPQLMPIHSYPAITMVKTPSQKTGIYENGGQV